ncbi:hypothetical protein Tco_1276310 [Tanacetum coccineum]
MDARPQITAKDNIQATILRYLKEWNPTLNMAALDAIDDKEEFIREGLDMLIVLAKRWPELLMDNDLYKCLMVIVGKENVESETLTKAIDLMLVFAKKGESSRDDLAVRLDQLSALFFHQIKVFKDVIEEEPESYHIGREGLVSVAFKVKNEC